MDTNLDVDLDVDNLLSFDLNTQLDLDDFHLDVGQDVNLEFDTLPSTDSLINVDEDQILAFDMDKLKADLSVLTAQSLEASDLPSSFELSSVQELVHPHIHPTDPKIGGYDANNNNNNNNSNLSSFVRGSANVDISIDDVLDLTSPDLGFDVPNTIHVSKPSSDSLLPFEVSPPSTPTLERSMAFSGHDRSLLENNEYLQDLGLTENGKLFVEDDDTLQSPLFRKVMKNEPNSPRPSPGEEFSLEDNEYDIYDDNSMIHDINLENELDDFGEIDKQFFAMNRSRSNSMAKQPKSPTLNVKTTRTGEGSKGNAVQIEGAKGGTAEGASLEEKALQEKLNQKIQERLEKVGEVDERNRSNSVSAPESLPKSDNVPPIVHRHDRSNSISEAEGVSVQSGANTVLMAKAAPNIRGSRRLSVGTLQENEKLTSAASKPQKSPHGSRPTTPSPKSGSREGSANSSRNNSRPSSRNSDTPKVPSGFPAKSPKTQEKSKETSDAQQTLDAASQILSTKAKMATPLSKTTPLAKLGPPKKSSSLPVTAVRPRSESTESPAPSSEEPTEGTRSRSGSDAAPAAANIKIPAGVKMSFLPPANSSMGSLLRRTSVGSLQELEDEGKKRQEASPVAASKPEEAIVDEDKAAAKLLPKSALKPQGSPSTPRRVKFTEKTDVIDEQAEQQDATPTPQPATSNLKTAPAAKVVTAPSTTPTTPSKAVESPSEEKSPAVKSTAPKGSLAAPKSPAAKTTALAAPKGSGVASPKTKAEEPSTPTSSPAKPPAKNTGLAAPKTSALTPPAKTKATSPAPKAPAPVEEEDDLRPSPPTTSPAKPATKSTGPKPAAVAPKSTLTPPKTGLAPPKSKLAAASPKATPAPVEEEDDLRPSPSPPPAASKPATKSTGLAAPKTSGLAAPKSALTPPKAKAPEPAPVEDEEDDLRPTPTPKSPASGLAPKASGLTPPKSGLAAPKASGLVAPKKSGIPSPGNKK